MQLSITGNNLTRNFADWLVSLIKLQIKGTFNKKKLQPFSNYVDLNTNIPVETFLKKALDSIVYTMEDDKELTIFIDKNVVFAGNVKLETLCRAINFGTLNQKGYPIFTDVFNNVAIHIKDHIKLYKLIGGNNT